MEYLGFLAGQIVVVVISFAYWFGPGKSPRTYLFERAGQHVGDAGIALFVFAAWSIGWLDLLAERFGQADLAGKLPDTPETLAGGFVAGGVCSALAWVIHARMAKREAEIGGAA